MAVNALVTGLIVFKILKVFLQVRATTGPAGPGMIAGETSVQRTLSSTGGNTKLQHIIFVIIESAMALFAIQLIRVVFTFFTSSTIFRVSDFIIVVQQMLNVIIRSIF